MRIQQHVGPTDYSHMPPDSVDESIELLQDFVQEMNSTDTSKMRRDAITELAFMVFDNLFRTLHPNATAAEQATNLYDEFREIRVRYYS